MQEGKSSSDGAHWFKADAEKPTVDPGDHPATKGPKHAAVEWSASEFIAHHKSFSWYLVLIICTAILSAGTYLLTRDRMTTGVIIFCGLIFGISAARKPRTLTYRLNNDGLTAGQRFYPYGEYKAFAVVDEGQFSCLSFMPLKRFMPSLNIYYDPEDEDRILDLLTEHLPLQPSTPSLLDSLIHRLRF